MRILGFDGVRAQDRGGFGFSERCFWTRMGISARGEYLGLDEKVSREIGAIVYLGFG